MGAPCVSACSPWATTEDLCSPCDDYAIDLDAMDRWLAVASDVLYELSGERFPGSCALTVRPCAQRYEWPNGCRCSRLDSCACRQVSSISLGVYPLTRVDEVLLDGSPLPPSSYRVDDFRWLVRLDGESWPCCQRLDLPSTETDTFQVTMTYGVGPPISGVLAAADLACELYKSCQPEQFKNCRLPPRVTDISRQGVSMSVAPALGRALQDGFTGIDSVDLFLKAYNPARIARKATVSNPDLASSYRRAGT